MKRRLANKIAGEYSQKRIDKDYFKGYVSFVKLKGLEEPFVVESGDRKVCIADEGYKWIEVYEDGAKFALTIMYDEKDNLIEWYFDIAREVGLQDGIPYEDDLYLDYVIEPNGKEHILDEEELLNALNNNIITKEDYDLAYNTLEFLKEKYSGKTDLLLDFSNRLKREFEE